MSWLYSRALVEEYSAARCLDGEQSAPLNSNHTPHAFLHSDRMTEFSRPKMWDEFDISTGETDDGNAAN